MRVLEAKEPGLLVVETAAVSEPIEWSAPALLTDPMGASDAPRREVEVFAFVNALDADAQEKHEIKVRARAWFGGFRQPELTRAHGISEARFRLVPKV